MATILYRNAQMLVNGAELTAALHDLSVDYMAEILDATPFGADTRVHKGGLYTGKIAGKGWFDGAVNTEPVLFLGVGSGAALASTQNPAYQSAVEIEDTIFAIFPDGVTEGSQTTGMGYALKGVLSTFNMGGADGTLLDCTFAAESRGIEA